MPDDTYLRQVAAALATQGVAAERRGDLVAEMHSHLVDSGEDPTEAFGPPEVFAERLVGTPVSSSVYRGPRRLGR